MLVVNNKFRLLVGQSTQELSIEDHPKGNSSTWCQQDPLLALSTNDAQLRTSLHASQHRPGQPWCYRLETNSRRSRKVSQTGEEVPLPAIPLAFLIFVLGVVVGSLLVGDPKTRTAQAGTTSLRTS